MDVRDDSIDDSITCGQL